MKFLVFLNKANFFQIKFSNSFDETGKNIDYVILNYIFDTKSKALDFIEVLKNLLPLKYENLLKTKELELSTNDISMLEDNGVDFKIKTRIIKINCYNFDEYLTYNSMNGYNEILLKILTYFKDYAYISPEPKKLSYTLEEIENIPEEFRKKTKEDYDKYIKEEKEFKLSSMYYDKIENAIKEKNYRDILDILYYFNFLNTNYIENIDYTDLCEKN